MRFKIAYIVFLISIIFYTNIKVVGPLTPRHIMSIMMFVICILEDNRVFLDKYFRWYLLFIFCFGFSSLWTYFLGDFLKFLLAYFFVAYVAYWATVILIKKYNGTTVLVNTFVVFGLLNALTTIGQFFEIDIFNRIPEIMRINVSEDFFELAEETDEFVGRSLPGLFSGAVQNGYFGMTATLLALWYQNKRFSLIRLIPWGICMIGLYVTQQRAPFFITSALSFFILFKVLGKERDGLTPILRLAFVVGIILGVFFLWGYISSSEIRYVQGFQDRSRSDIIRKAIEYLSQHVLFGGRFHSRSLGVRPPHNLFLNAWLYGGVLGLIAVAVITVKQVVAVVKQVLSENAMDEYEYVSTILGLTFLAYTSNAMVHNQSIVTGDSVVWILWGAFLSQVTLDNEEDNNENEEDEEADILETNVPALLLQESL